MKSERESAVAHTHTDRYASAEPRTTNCKDRCTSLVSFTLFTCSIVLVEGEDLEGEDNKVGLAVVERRVAEGGGAV